MRASVCVRAPPKRGLKIPQKLTLKIDSKNHIKK